eukprot:Amastigsp_a845478_7.p2 type:complete len:129 gc:universal Amastigsp_a845478_7:842-456(-)
MLPASKSGPIPIASLLKVLASVCGTLFERWSVAVQQHARWRFRLWSYDWSRGRGTAGRRAPASVIPRPEQCARVLGPVLWLVRSLCCGCGAALADTRIGNGGAASPAIPRRAAAVGPSTLAVCASVQG